MDIRSFIMSVIFLTRNVTDCVKDLALITIQVNKTDSLDYI